MKTPSNKVILITVFIGLCALITGINAYFTPNSNVIETTGRIVYIDLEGGFFVIIGDDKNYYDPINLPKDYEVNGLRIAFRALRRDDLDSVHMIGTIIQILNIRLIFFL